MVHKKRHARTHTHRLRRHALLGSETAFVHVTLYVTTLPVRLYPQAQFNPYPDVRGCGGILNRGEAYRGCDQEGAHGPSGGQVPPERPGEIFFLTYSVVALAV